MHAGELAVDIAGAHPIDRLKVQDQTVRIADLPYGFLAAERHRMHDGTVPDHVIGVDGLMYAGKCGFR